MKKISVIVLILTLAVFSGTAGAKTVEKTICSVRHCDKYYYRETTYQKDRENSVYRRALDDFMEEKFFVKNKTNVHNKQSYALSMSGKQRLVFNLVDPQMYSSVVSQDGGAMAAEYKYATGGTDSQLGQMGDISGQKEMQAIASYQQAVTSLSADIRGIDSRLGVSPWVNQQVYSYYGHMLDVRFGSLSASRLKILTGGGTAAGLKNEITYAKILQGFDTFLYRIRSNPANTERFNAILGTRMTSSIGEKVNNFPATFSALLYSLSWGGSKVSAKPQLYNRIQSLVRYPIISNAAVNFYSVTFNSIRRMYSGSLGRAGREILIDVVNGNYRAALRAFNSIPVPNERVTVAAAYPAIYKVVVAPYLSVLKAGDWKKARAMIQSVDANWIKTVVASKISHPECVNPTSKADPLMKTLLYHYIAAGAGNTPWSGAKKRRALKDMLKAWDNYVSWELMTGQFSECTGILPYHYSTLYVNTLENQYTNEVGGSTP